MSLIARRASYLTSIRPPAPTRAGYQLRHQSTQGASDTTPATAQLSSRWLSDVKQRIGKCIAFGLTPAQTAAAGAILQQVSKDWRELVAGSEGFLTSHDRRGLHRTPIAWGDQDSMGHVNNVMYNRYAESGRVAWANKYARFVDPEHKHAWANLATPKGEVGMILRKITTDFKFPMKYPDHISVYHKLHDKPTESTDTFMLDAVIMSEVHQRIAARVYEDCALYDYNLGKKTNMGPYPWMVEVLQETWRLQEDAKRVNSERVWKLLDRVRELEKDSWDREDAVEDMGGGR